MFILPLEWEQQLICGWEVCAVRRDVNNSKKLSQLVEEKVGMIWCGGPDHVGLWCNEKCLQCEVS